MSVVVGYVPRPEGEAALEQAIAQARTRDTRLVVVNSSRGDALVDERYVQANQVAVLEKRLASAGVDHLLV